LEQKYADRTGSKNNYEKKICVSSSNLLLANIHKKRGPKKKKFLNLEEKKNDEKAYRRGDVSWGKKNCSSRGKNPWGWFLVGRE